MPRPGSQWLHYKGGVATVDGVGLHTETGEVLVTYFKDGERWCRPLLMWHNQIVHQGCIRARFEQVENAVDLAFYSIPIGTDIVHARYGRGRVGMWHRSSGEIIVDFVDGVQRWLPWSKDHEAIKIIKKKDAAKAPGQEKPTSQKPLKNPYSTRASRERRRKPR